MSTNLCYVVISLFTNTPPSTNFATSGQMQVVHQVYHQYVYVCTNQGRLVLHTNRQPAFDFSEYFQKESSWVPAPGFHPGFTPLPQPQR